MSIQSSEAPLSPTSSDNESTGFRWSTRVGVPILCVCLGSIATIGWHLWTSRLRVIHYYVAVSPAIITKPELGDGRVEVLVDGAAVDNISTARVELFNRTDQDFVDVPVTISFAPTDGGPAAMLRSVVRPRADAPVIDVATEVDSLGVTHFKYSIVVANRSEDPVMQVEYSLKGSEVPEIAVAVPLKGVRVSPITVGQDDSKPSFLQGLGFVVVVVLVLYVLTALKDLVVWGVFELLVKAGYVDRHRSSVKIAGLYYRSWGMLPDMNSSYSLSQHRAPALECDKGQSTEGPSAK